MEINITVPGQPYPQARPRFTSFYTGKKVFNKRLKRTVDETRVQAYDSEKSADYKKLVARYAMQHKPETLLEGALEVRIDIYKETLKSFSNAKKSAAEAKLLRPTTKPDADNYAKGPIDALKGIIWNDDGQVVDLLARKFYSSNPRIEITVRTLDNQQIELI